MRKLRLHLDDLAVDTFHTLPEDGADARGTLIAHQDAAAPPTTDCLTQIPPTQLNCPTLDCVTPIPPTHYCDTMFCLTGTGA